MAKVDDQKIYRLIDANFNRAKEAFRVCEDICRFYLDHPALTRRYKTARHDLTKYVETIKIAELIKSRQIETDVGRKSTQSEFKRSNVSDIFYANSQRIKESIRVLEECVKLFNKKTASDLKQLRYKVYSCEKKVVEQF